MRTLLLAALILALGADAADARRKFKYRHDGRGAEQHDVARYGFERSRIERPRDESRSPARDGMAALVPRDWQMVPPDPSWQGQRFVSPQGDAWVAFYASPADDKARDAHLKGVAFAAGEELTYLRRERDWLVVSGFKGERIFYRKVVLACDAREWRHVALEYPAEAKRAFDPLIARAARALDFAGANRCAPERRD